MTDHAALQTIRCQDTSSGLQGRPFGHLLLTTTAAMALLQVHPAKFTRALVSCAESNGASVRIGTVQGLQTASDASGSTCVTGDQVQLPALLSVVQGSLTQGHNVRFLRSYVQAFKWMASAYLPMWS